jgi:hypothetical protein
MPFVDLWLDSLESTASTVVQWLVEIKNIGTPVPNKFNFLREPYEEQISTCVQKNAKHKKRTPRIAGAY